MKKILSLLLVLVMVGATLAACGKKADPVTPGTDTPGTETPGTETPDVEDDIFSQPDTRANTLTVGTIESSGTYLPLYASASYDADVVDLIFEGLITRDKDALIVPNVATKWEISEDSKTYTFYMNPDVKFSDGTPVTAHDVEFTYKAIAHPDFDGILGAKVQDMVGADAYSAGETDVFEGVKVIDEHTISFTFNEVMRPNLATADVGILSKAYYSNDGEIDFDFIKTKLDQPFGSGPYVVEEFVLSQYTSLTRNPLWVGEGYNIKNLVIKYVSNATEMDELLTGNVEALFGQIQPVNVDAARDAGFEIVQYPRSGYGFIRFNCESTITSDVKVRQAVAYAFDRYKFVEDMYGDLAVTQATPLSQVSWAYTENLKAQMNPYHRDTDAAAKLLEEAGWTLGADGFRVKDGQRLTIRFAAMPDHSVLDVLVPVFKAELAEVGIDVVTNYLEFNPLLAKVEQSDDNDWEIYFMATSIYTPDPDDIYTSYHSDFAKAGARNTANFKNAEVDKLFDDGRVILKEEDAVAHYEKLALALNEQMPNLVVYANVYSDFISPRVNGYETTSFYRWTQALRDLTLSADDHYVPQN